MDREARIQKRAYEIWEREGRPHGRDAEHWRQAAAEIDAEDRTAAAPAPRRGRAAAKDGSGGRTVASRVKRAAEGLTEKVAAVAGSAVSAGAQAATDTVRSAIREAKPGRKPKVEAAGASTRKTRGVVEASAAPVSEAPKRRGRPPKVPGVSVAAGGGAPATRRDQTAQPSTDDLWRRRGKSI